MAKECPVCQLINTDIAQRCDCGYDFTSHHVARSYAYPDDPEIQAEYGMSIRQVGVRNIKRGLSIAAGCLVFFVWGAVQGGFPFLALGGVATSCGVALRGLSQYRRGRKLEQERAATRTRLLRTAEQPTSSAPPR